MELSDKQKRYILKHDYYRTVEQIAEKLGVSCKDVMDCYSEMVDSGYYVKYRKPNWRDKK